MAENICLDNQLHADVCCRYLKPDRVTIDFAGFMEDLSIAKEGSVVLLHACAHNPTGRG